MQAAAAGAVAQKSGSQLWQTLVSKRLQQTQRSQGMERSGQQAAHYSSHRNRRPSLALVNVGVHVCVSYTIGMRVEASA